MTKDGLSGAGPGRLASCPVVRGIGPVFRSPILHSWDSTPEAALQTGGYRRVETAEAKCLTGTSTVLPRLWWEPECSPKTHAEAASDPSQTRFRQPRGGRTVGPPPVPSCKEWELRVRGKKNKSIRDNGSRVLGGSAANSGWCLRSEQSMILTE